MKNPKTELVVYLQSAPSYSFLVKVNTDSLKNNVDPQKTGIRVKGLHFGYRAAPSECRGGVCECEPFIRFDKTNITTIYIY